MNIDQQLQQLASLRYPKQVDVVEGVMARVAAQRRAVLPFYQRSSFRIIVSGAVAAALLVLAVNTTVVRHQAADEQMGSVLAQLYDNSSYQCSAAIESAAFDDYAYED